MPKPAPIQRCGSCGCVPMGDDELALAFMLTGQFLPKEKLAEASGLIKTGQRIQLPPQIRTAVLAAIQSARTQQAESRKLQSRTLYGWGMLLGISVLLSLLFHPWPHYQWSSSHDTVASYKSFVDRFPSSDYADTAREKIRLMNEPDVWLKAKENDQIEALRGYVRVYLDGKYLDEAKRRVTELANAQWKLISKSRSETEIRAFLTSYPETTKTSEVEARLQDLFNEWEWVREQDKLQHYQRFLARNPAHSQAEWISKRIIDLEVAEIASGDYGTLREPELLGYGGKGASVEIHNRTRYNLTVRYSGKRESKKIDIPIGEIGMLSLPDGEYKVAASVDAANVTNYYGKAFMHVGRFKTSFEIVTYKSKGSFPFLSD